MPRKKQLPPLSQPDFTASTLDRTQFDPMPSSSGRKVTVVLCLGVAYLTLQLCEIVEKWENTQSGPRLVKEAIRLPKKIYVRGTAYPRGTPPEGFPEKPLIIGNAAINPNIDADFFEAWMEQNKLNPLVVNKVIYGYEKHEMAVDEAKERAKQLSGLEPLNPKSDPRMQKSTNPAVSDIETEESRAAKMAHVA